MTEDSHQPSPADPTPSSSSPAAPKKVAKKATRKAAKKAPAKKEPAASATPAAETSAPPKEQRDQPERRRESNPRREEPRNNDRSDRPDSSEDQSPQQDRQERSSRRSGGPVGRAKKQGRNNNNRNNDRNNNRRNNNNGRNGNGNGNNGRQNNRNAPNNQNNGDRPERDRRPTELTGEKIDTDGLLELSGKGFGFLRNPKGDFEQSSDDVFVPPEIVRAHGLRASVWIKGKYQESNRGPQLVEITTINDLEPAEALKLPHFEELKAINPNKRLSFEHDPKQKTTRVLDVIAPVGRGQRGLIVSPPRSGKTTLLMHIAEAARDLHEDTLHLMILLVDERPEEVTEFKRNFPEAEIYASSNDQPARSHCRLAEMCVERAKRLVEAGQDVFILMDSITRLARAYNNNSQGGGNDGGNKKGGRFNKGRQQQRGNGGYQSGGISVGALEMPRRLFAAARNTREAGSLTILATALVQTNAKADEAIFQEFKGTGNMELVLDRKIAEQYIYPAVDIFKSGTRREELIMPELQLKKVHMIRRGLSGHRPEEAMERLLFFFNKHDSNAQMLLEIKG